MQQDGQKGLLEKPSESEEVFMARGLAEWRERWIDAEIERTD